MQKLQKGQEKKSKRLTHRRHIRFIICPDCGKRKKHYGKGRCAYCYQKNYDKEHPEREIKQRQYLRKKYREDKEYREKLKKQQKKFNNNPKNAEKRKEYGRNYYKNHPKSRFETKRIGFLCECGGIDKGNLGGRTTKHFTSQKNKCPHCGRFTEKRKVVFNRLTNQVIEIIA